MIAPDKVQSEAKKRENTEEKEHVYEKGTLWTGRYYVKSYNEIV